MNIAVVAANGRSGRAFVEAALAAGHMVRAGVRTPANATFTPHALLTVVKCDATVQEDVSALIKDQDAVVSMIGHVRGSAADVHIRAITCVIQAMGEQGVTRLVSLTGTGVRFAGDEVTLVDRFLNKVIELTGLSFCKDGIQHVEYIKQSELDWTIIRALLLTNNEAAPFQLKEHGPAKLFVSREEVALAALQVLEKHTYIKQAPIIGV